MSQFFPALHPNAVIDRKVYGVPFHNSTPLLYYNVDHFKEAGLDPDKPPKTWQEADRRRQEARQARRRSRHALGHHDALELRLRRLDPAGADDVERRTLV